MKKKKPEADSEGDPNSGWNSPVCTKSRCGKALDFGAGMQFVDEEGNQQRYCWPDWVKYNADPKRFPGVIETKSPEGK